LIYFVVNLNRNKAHFANFAFLTAHFASKLLIALGLYFAQNFASKFGQGLPRVVITEDSMASLLPNELDALAWNV